MADRRFLRLLSVFIPSRRTEDVPRVNHRISPWDGREKRAEACSPASQLVCWWPASCTLWEGWCVRSRPLQLAGARTDGVGVSGVGSGLGAKKGPLGAIGCKLTNGSLVLMLALFTQITALAPVNAEESLNSYEVSGPACSLNALGDSTRIVCSHFGASLLVANGEAVRFSIVVPSVDAGGDFLIQRAKDQGSAVSSLREKASRILELCESNENCSSALSRSGATNEGRCLHEMYLADAVSFFEFNGELTPVLSAGRLLVCRDQAGFFLAFESNLSTSFVIDGKSGPSTEEIAVFVFAALEEQN